MCTFLGRNFKTEEFTQKLVQQVELVANTFIRKTCELYTNLFIIRSQTQS